MLYGQIKLGSFEDVARFFNDNKGAIAGGLGGGLLTGGASYLSADNNKLKKGLLGAIPGALAGGYAGNMYDNSNAQLEHTDKLMTNYKSLHQGVPYIEDEPYQAFHDRFTASRSKAINNLHTLGETMEPADSYYIK